MYLVQDVANAVYKKEQHSIKIESKYKTLTL